MAEAEVASPVPDAPPPSVGTDSQVGGPSATSVKDDNWRPVAQPIRDDRVQNAVNFLSHPKVRGSPVQYRRTFLERKGLTKEEIDEAFRRVPDSPSSTTANSLAPRDTQAAPLVQSDTAQGVGQLAATPHGIKQYRWTQMLLAVGLLASAGAGTGFVVKRWLLPKFKTWIRHIALDETAEKSKAVQTDDQDGVSAANSVTTAAAAASLAAAASEIALATQEMIRSRAEEREAHNVFIKAMEAQTKEVRSALSSIQEAYQDTSRRGSPRDFLGDRSVTGGDFNWNNRPASATSWEAQHAARNSIVKSARSGPVADFQKVVPSNTLIAQQAPGRTNPVHAPHSHNYQEIIAMVERGETPPGIRAVNDKPPNPEQLPSFPQLQPKQKPWEVGTSAGLRPADGSIEQSRRFTGEKPSVENGSAAVHSSPVRSEASSLESWWRQQKVGSAVQIAELESAEDHQGQVDLLFGSISAGTVSGHGTSKFSSSKWLPPPIPARSLPGAVTSQGVQGTGGAAQASAGYGTPDIKEEPANRFDSVRQAQEDVEPQNSAATVNPQDVAERAGSEVKSRGESLEGSAFE